MLVLLAMDRAIFEGCRLFRLPCFLQVHAQDFAPADFGGACSANNCATWENDFDVTSCYECRGSPTSEDDICCTSECEEGSTVDSDGVVSQHRGRGRARGCSCYPYMADVAMPPRSALRF